MYRLAMAMTPERATDVFDPDTRAALEAEHEVVWAKAPLDEAEVRRVAAGADILVTSWGTPPLPADLFAEGGPRAVAHAAGTVKNLVTAELADGGPALFSAASRIAWSVGEYCLATTLTMLRRVREYDASTRAGSWRPEVRGRELRGRRVGIVGGSSTARAFLTMLAPFQVDALIYDPYLASEAAAGLGARLAPLAEVMTAEIVSIHVPDLPSTRGMIDADLLAAMPDGGLLINSARALALDQDALIREVGSGRLRAALDVFPAEPATSFPQPLSDARGSLLTPHIAGDTLEGHQALGGYVVGDALAYLDAGVRGPSHVDPASWSISA